ncbi:TOBE domain-containing protein [Candidatus Gracilibacteria bacterium]|nr:TOBE domain-containing protein [Candidatus Gracilibacteria bacterium]
MSVLIYPEAALLLPEGGAGARGMLATINAKQFRGRFYQTELAIGGTKLVFEFDYDPGALGATVNLQLDPQHIVVLPATGAVYQCAVKASFIGTPASYYTPTAVAFGV